MTDLKDRFRTLDRLDAPDLWPEAERRRPGTLRLHRRPSRFVAAAVAFAVTAVGIGLVVRAFNGGIAGQNPQPAISVPHGAIAFVRVAGPAIDAAREIYLMEPDGSDVERLTDAGAQGTVAAEPAWSPDGTRIAFVRSTPEHLGAFAGDGDIYLMNADGTGLIQLTEGLRDALPAWSPDGTRIVFVRDQGNSLVVMNADGSGASELRLDGEAYPPYQSPSWSPDGTRIAFQASPTRGVDTNSVYVANVDGTGTTRFTDGLSDGSPAWSADGATIAYAGPDGIYLLDVATGSEHRLTRCRFQEDCGFDFEPSWASDGSRIAFSRQDGGGTTIQVFVVNADGTGLQQLTSGPEWNRDPSWQPVPAEEESLPATQGMGQLVSGFGLALKVPASWDGRVYQRRDGAILQAAPVSLNDLDRDAAGHVRNQIGADQFVIEIADEDVAPFGVGLTAAALPVRIHPEDLCAQCMEGSPANHAVGRYVLSVDGRRVVVFVEFGSNPPSEEWLNEANAILATLVIESRCIQAETSGDFDGDGTVDSAEFVEVVSGSVSCDREREVFENLSSQELVIRFGSGQTLEQPFTDCQGGLCAYVFVAADLDGDGSDELAIDVTYATATAALVEFYRVDPDGIRPLVIADPGDPPYVEPGPAILGGGFDSGLQSPIECRVTADGTRELVSVHAENVGDSLFGPWKVHTTTMTLRDDGLVVISTSDSERTYSTMSEVFHEVFQSECS